MRQIQINSFRRTVRNPIVAQSQARIFKSLLFAHFCLCAMRESACSKTHRAAAAAAREECCYLDLTTTLHRAHMENDKSAGNCCMEQVHAACQRGFPLGRRRVKGSINHGTK